MSEIIRVEKINESLMKIVLDGSITLKQFNINKKYIAARCDYIVRKIMEIQRVQLFWWDFDNGGYPEGSPEGCFDPDLYSQKGCFDPDLYSQSVRFNCDHAYVLNFSLLPYHNNFPTRWICVDFEEECEREYQKAMQKWTKLKNDYNINKEKRDKLKAEALQKLTPEERKALGF